MSAALRSPLLTTVIPRLVQKSTSIPSSSSTVTFGQGAQTSRSMATRSSALNSERLLALRPTATTTCSTRAAVRPITSRWPRVTGSKEPGQAAVVMGRR